MLFLQSVKKGKTKRRGKRIPKYEEDILIEQDMQLMLRAQKEAGGGGGEAKKATPGKKTKGKIRKKWSVIIGA